MRTNLSILVIIILSSLVLVPEADAQNPTTEWVNFYSSNTTVNGKPAPVGSIVEAYDPHDVLCGKYTVSTAGYYGFLACYLDDPGTLQDEGIHPGDIVTFKINGEFAGKFRIPTSIGNGDRFKVDLAVEEENRPFTCIDSYEPNHDATQANEITGPEAHTFWNPPGLDEDWAKLHVRTDWIYQIKAYKAQVWAPTDPLLRIYDIDGNLLEENDNYFRNDAEIWWWNDGPDQIVYIQAVEADDNDIHCLHYTLEVISWNPGEFRRKFGKK